jgi:PAS domain-containing protein
MPATADVLGYAPADIVGVQVRDLVEPIDRDAGRRSSASCSTIHTRPVRGTFRLPSTRTARCAGPKAWHAISCRKPRVGGIVVYYRDVTARKGDRAATERNRDRYGHLFSSAADVIFEADARATFRFVNPQTLKLFEFEQDEVIGRRFTEFIRADFRRRFSTTTISRRGMAG